MIPVALHAGDPIFGMSYLIECGKLSRCPGSGFHPVSTNYIEKFHEVE
jgi:hypothetical protein